MRVCVNELRRQEQDPDSMHQLVFEVGHHVGG
jgi:hypothetical protein